MEQSFKLISIIFIYSFPPPLSMSAEKSKESYVKSVKPNFFHDHQTSFKKAKAVILPVPFDYATTCSTNQRDGPNAIICASSMLFDYDEL